MIDEKYIEKIENELTEEQFNKLIYYLSKDKLMELKELTRKKVKNRFVIKMRKYIKKYLLLEKENVRPESINLFIQAQKTIQNVHKFIKKEEIVDANVLLRSAFENIVMGTMISIDSNVYNEFIDLSINDKTRFYTKPQTLRNNFRKVLKKIDGNFFNEIGGRKLRNLLNEFYNGLCSYTHSTLIISAMIEIEKDNDLDLYILFTKQNAYFVELLLYLCLNHLMNVKDNPIDMLYVVLGWYILLLDFPKEKISSDKINKIYKLLYIDVNKEYCDKSKGNIKSLEEEIEEVKKEIESNPLGIIKILEEVIK